MNDLGAPNWNNLVHLNRQDRPAVERETGNAPKQRRRRRWGGRLFAFGGFLLLAGGLGYGGWQNYTRHNEVSAIADSSTDEAWV